MYAAAGEYSLALQAYKKRVEMEGGFQGEVFWSLYTMGRMQELLGMSSQIAIESYQKAHEERPWRIEPLFYMGLAYAREGFTEQAYAILKKASQAKGPVEDNFFLECEVVWRLQHVLADLCWRLGKVQETLDACEKLVVCEDTPKEIVQVIEQDILKIKESVQKGVLFL